MKQKISIHWFKQDLRLRDNPSINYLSDRNNEINQLKSILSSNKGTVDSVRNLKNENSELSKTLKKSQKKLWKIKIQN